MRKRIFQKEARTEGRVEPDQWWEKQHSLVLRQTPRWAQSFVLGIIILSGGAIVATNIIRIDEVISVQGILVPISGSHEVKTPAGGQVSKVLVNDGDYVKEGDVLIKFDTRRAVEELSRLEVQLIEQKKSFDSRKRAVEQRKRILERKYETNLKILKRVKALRDVGAIEDNTVLRQEDQSLELKAQILELEENTLQAKSQYIQSIDRIKSQIFLNQLQIQYETVTSPKEGIVFESAASIKGVLNGGEVIMKIVPQDRLKAEIMVTNKDIGYVKVGQNAQVRVAAYDYTEFGELKGKISSIGADALPPDAENNQYRYPVQVTLEQNNLKKKNIKVPVKSGMAISANIKLRDKKLISIVSDILSDNKDAINQLRQ